MLHVRFREVQTLEEWQRSARFKTSTPPPSPSPTKMLDSEVIDTGLTLCDTLPGGVKPR